MTTHPSHWTAVEQPHTWWVICWHECDYPGCYGWSIRNPLGVSYP